MFVIHYGHACQCWLNYASTAGNLPGLLGEGCIKHIMKLQASLAFPHHLVHCNMLKLVPHFVLHGPSIGANASLAQKFYHYIHVRQPLCYESTCIQVLGAFVKLGHWLPLMVDSVAAPQASLPTRVNALVVLSAMLHAAGMPLSLCWQVLSEAWCAQQLPHKAAEPTCQFMIA